MNIGQDFNQDNSQYLIRRELEESNDNDKEQEHNEMEYYYNEPSELIDIKFIEDFSREKFFSYGQPNINNNQLKLNKNNIIIKCFNNYQIKIFQIKYFFK